MKGIISLKAYNFDPRLFDQQIEIKEGKLFIYYPCMEPCVEMYEKK